MLTNTPRTANLFGSQRFADRISLHFLNSEMTMMFSATSRSALSSGRRALSKRSYWTSSTAGERRWLTPRVSSSAWRHRAVGITTTSDGVAHHHSKLLVCGLATTTNTINHTTTRNKSSVALMEEDDHEQELEHILLQGHAAASEASPKSHAEAWMINLGRNRDNEWLTGSRPDAWWTGVHPRTCPGT